ncbi:MAG: hypothetical protein ABWY82_14975, partial [Tardiphaga sp.]
MAADLVQEVRYRRNCHAVGAATRLYNSSDLAQKSRLVRPSIHRAFVLDAMGFRLHVTVRWLAQGAARL